MHLNFKVTEQRQIHIKDYSYDLPEERIARYPLDERSNSKLLISEHGKNINHIVFKDIDSSLPSGSHLIINNTKVIFARLIFRKKTGSKIEIFCLHPLTPSDYESAFSVQNSCTWKCMVGNLKKWKEEILELQVNNIHLYAEKITVNDKHVEVRFKWDEENSFGEILNQAGVIPIPPYLNRNSEIIDKERYQTIYSQFKGSVAAPTAGLHFTEDVFQKLEKKNIFRLPLTLHIGAGTFQPVKSENAMEHTMHSEDIIITRELIQKLLLNKTNISTGTTSTRTLESIYWLAHLIHDNKIITDIPQFVYRNLKGTFSRTGALQVILDFMIRNDLQEFSVPTQLMIIPGYKFMMTDILITNFHQPGSTLLLLIAAFTGERWKEIYKYALENDFRFLSYGDSSLLYPSPSALL